MSQLSFSIRQLGQEAPQLKQRLDQLYDVLEGNDALIVSLQQQLKNNETLAQLNASSRKAINGEKRALAGSLKQLDEGVGQFRERFLDRQSGIAQGLWRKVQKLTKGEEGCIVEVPQPYYKLGFRIFIRIKH